MNYNSEFDKLTNGSDGQKDHILEAIEGAIWFINSNFDVNQKKYAEALKCLRICRLIFQNKHVRKPNKKAMHFLLDVLHEIEDIRATSEDKLKENEETAQALSLVIDIFAKD